MKSLTDTDGIDGPFERGMAAPIAKPKRTIDERIEDLRAKQAEQMRREKARALYDGIKPRFKARNWPAMLRELDQLRVVVVALCDVAAGVEPEDKSDVE